MRKIIFCVVCLGGFAATAGMPARAADANSQAPRVSSSQPAAQPTIPDLLGGAIDPYQPGLERAKFFKAAGVDNELDAKEFRAARKMKGAFVRKFDKWQAMLAFDKNHNGLADWFEAKAYRQNIRRRILSAFDKNRDGKLKGPERQAANKMLASGRIPGQAPVLAKRVEIPEATTAPADETTADTPPDASDKMREKMLRLREKALAKYDRNGDGKLDQQEQAMADTEAARRGDRSQTWQATMTKWRLRNFDGDGDGQINEKEQAEAKEFEAKFREMGQVFHRKMTDLNGDGEISDAERQAVRKEWKKASWSIFAKSFRYMDADGDGQISPGERSDFRQQMQSGAIGYIERLSESFDSNRDGRLDAAERDSLIAGMTKQFEQRIEKFDADRDGRLSPPEAITMMEQFVQEELGIRPAAPATKPAE